MANADGEAEILVGIDGSDGSEQALRWAVREARLREALVRAVLVWAAAGPPDAQAGGVPPATCPGSPRWVAQAMLDDVVEKVRAEHPTARIVAHAEFGQPVDTLLALSRGAELLVLGARGQGTQGHRLAGSVSMACVHDASVPTVIVHGSGAFSGSGVIVVGVDGSAAVADALQWAADEALLRGACLRLVHVWAPLPPPLARQIGADIDPLREDAEAVLRSAQKGLARLRNLEVETELIRGGASHGLLQAAEKAELLVVGARGGGGFTGLLLGSTSFQCALHADCPVAVIR